MVALKLVTSPKDYPDTIKDTQRPFRVWDSAKKKYVPGRFYATERRAQDSALLLVRYEKIGYTLEVLDIRYGRWLGTYERRVAAIAFTGRTA